MDYEHIKQLAERRASAQRRVHNLGIMNTADTVEKRIAADVQYRLARDAADAAEREYQELMRGLSAADLEQLVHLHNSEQP